MLRAPFILLFNLLRLLSYLWSAFWFRIGYFFRRKKKLYIRLDLHSNYSFGPPAGWAKYFQQQPSFLELRDTIKRLRSDPTLAGVVLVSESSALGMGRGSEVHRLLDSLRAAGKHVVAHTQMPMSADYLTLTSADHILVSPAGRLYTFGPRIEQMFAHEALQKLGVVPQFIHIGEFKTASHRFIHSEMTLAQRLMMQSLYEDLRGLMLARIAARRQLTPAQADTLFAHAPMDCRQARHQGFIDAEVFQESIPSWLEAREAATPVGLKVFSAAPAPLPLTAPPPAGAPHTTPGTVQDGANAQNRGRDATPGTPGDQSHAGSQVVVEFSHQSASIVKADAYLRAAPKPYRWRPLLRRPAQIAVLDLSGMIVMPNMKVPGQSARVIDPHQVLPALRLVRENPRYLGAILHINSPGGSALASDIIWQAIAQLRQAKPVIAQCSDVVGSGGYYLAVGADEIVCERATLTGSIGVITGKMSAPDLAPKLGVHIDTICTHDADNFSSLTHPLSPEMMARMDADARSFYRRFLERVGQARQVPRRRLHRYARGRVYLGEAAQARGLIDHIGGLDVALERMGARLNLDATDARLAFISHQRDTLRSALRGSALAGDLLGGGAARLGAQISAHLDETWLEPLTRSALIATILKHDPILALMPFDIR